MGTSIITDRGFDRFILGTCGNAGQNLYVSRQGAIQRIHHFDINGDGFVDIPFVNSHDDDTRVPAYLYVDPLHTDERVELPTNGAYAAAIGDLNNDGYDDLVIANHYDGVSNELHAQIYYGSSEGWSSKYMMQLWAPCGKDVEIGDFNGDGRKDIAFISREMLRIFYQNGGGFQAGGYIDLPLTHSLESLAAADLDGDGYDDLVIRSNDKTIRIYWGGPDGLRSDRFTLLDQELTGYGEIESAIDQAASGAGGGSLTVYGVPASPRLKTVVLNGRPHLYVSLHDRALFLAFRPDRSAQLELSLNCRESFSAAVGDINGDGFADLVLASRHADDSGVQYSWIYWGSEAGYSDERRTHAATMSVNDVKLGDLNGNGCADVIFCQDKMEDRYTFESLIYEGMAQGISSEPVRLLTHCALDVFVVQTALSASLQVLFLNRWSNRILGDVPATFYVGGPDGYRPDRRIELPGWAATEVKVCDFNDDGYPDVFIANCNENAMHLERGSYIYYGGPEGYSTERRIELPTRFTMSGCVADLNRDGWLDLVAVGHSNDELLVFYGSGNGFASDPQRIKLEFAGIRFSQPRFMTLADLNRDGWLDLVIPECGNSGKTIILWGGSDGFDNEHYTLLSTGPTVSSRVADLDGDGWPDLLLGGITGEDGGDRYRTFLYIYWGGSEGFSNDRRTQLPANFAVDVTVADFNNDGILDIFVACYHGLRTRDLDSYLYWGKPGGRYSAWDYTRLFHHSASGALAADFNEDGYVDLAVANHKTYGNHPGCSYVWWNGPDGFDERNRTSLPTVGPHGITHSDIGNIMDRGPEEYYESRPLELPAGTSVCGIAWKADVPPKTWVKVQLRTAAREDDLLPAPWMGPEGEDTWFEHPAECGHPNLSGSWVQYRLALGATNSVASPRVTEVEVAYR